MRPPRTLKITREGRYYLGFTLGVGIAATNTGNNLLFLILGMLLSLIIVSGLLSEAALRRLEVVRLPAGPYRAGEPCTTRVGFKNGNTLLPSIGLEVDEVLAPLIESSPGRCLRVLAGSTGYASLSLRPTRRGRLELIGLKVTTRYPFGIFAKSRRYELPTSIVAWPGRVPPRSSRQGDGGEEIGLPQPRGLGVEDLRGLRPFRDGDEARLVHWRRSLRVGQMLVVERDAPLGRRLTLRLEHGAGEAFEEAVRVTAAQAEHHLSIGDEVALDAPEGHSVPFGRGPGHRRRLLFSLALVPPVDSASQQERSGLTRLGGFFSKKIRNSASDGDLGASARMAASPRGRPPSDLGSAS